MTLAAVTMLTACNPASSDKPVHDVAYFLDHAYERKAQMAECQNNPGELADTPNCRNAAAAQQKAMFQGTGMPSMAYRSNRTQLGPECGGHQLIRTPKVPAAAVWRLPPPSSDQR